MSALKIKDDQGNWINLPGLKGDKGDKGDKGESGVYLGTTAPSDEDINVWINPNGEAHTEAVVIDDTLSVEGRAADAKVTGDKINGIRADLSSVDDELHPVAIKTLQYDDITWERGYLKIYGTVGTNETYMVSAYMPVSEGDSVVYDGLRSPSPTYPIISGYESPENYVSGSNASGDGSNSQSGTYTVPSGVSYIRFSTYDYDGINKFNSVTMPVKGDRISDINARLDDIDDRFDEVDDRLDALEVESPMYQYTFGFDDFEYTTGIVASKDGETSRLNGQATDYISTENILSIGATTVKMPIYTAGHEAAIIACYDSEKNLLTGKSLFATGTYGALEEITGTVTITPDISFVRLSRLSTNADTSVFVVTKKRTLAEDYNVTKEEVVEIEGKLNPWKGKNWFAFGTSMTDDWYPNVENDRKPTGVFPKYLQELSGMVQFNHGKAGGTISTDPTSQYHPSGQIYTEITNTDFSSADLITLEGFINDFAACVALGNLGDMTQDTFYGALYLCIKYLSEHNTNATIVVITDPVGKEYTFTQGESAGLTQNYSTTKVNALGLRQVDYSNAIIKTCQWMGVHCIDAGGKSQINEYHPQYIVDQCHQTELGGKQLAYTIWEELKNIHPNTDVTVDV